MAKGRPMFQALARGNRPTGKAPPGAAVERRAPRASAAGTRRPSPRLAPCAPIAAPIRRSPMAGVPAPMLAKDAPMARPPNDARDPADRLAALDPTADLEAAREGGHEETVLPIVEERARIEAQDRVVGRVRVRTVTREEDVELAETLRSSRVEVERVPVDAFVDEAPQMREEDGVTIIPVLEEVLVRRLVLREEIRIRHVAEEREVRETVTLRTQEPVIERDPDDGTTR